MAGAEGGLRDGTLRHNATPDGSGGGDPAKTDRRAMLDEWRKQMRAKEGGGTGTTTPAGGGTPARPVGSARPPSASFEDGHDKKRARMNDDAHDGGGGGGAGAGPLPLPPQQHLPPVAPLPAQPPMAAPSPPTAGDVGGGTALERFKARQALRQQREQQMAAGCDDHQQQQQQQHHAMPPLPPAAAAAAAAAAPTRSAICYDDDDDDDHHHPADQDADHDNRSVASGRSHHSAASGRGRGGGGTAGRGATPSRAGTPLRGRAGRMSLIGVGAARKPAKANGGAAGGGSRRQTMAASGGRVGSSTPTSGMAHAHNAGAASATLPPAPGEYTDVCTHMHIAMLPSPCILLVSNI